MIKIETHATDGPLYGQSKWWGQPDMPEDMEYPEVTVVDADGEEYEEPLTFVCQIRCEDLVRYDREELLPDSGMLYFFAALDYFFGDFDAPLSPGMGLWQEKYYKVLYASSIEDLHTHKIVYEDGRPYGLPAEAITFSCCEQADYGIRMLGRPYLDEVYEEMPDMISLLQIDEDDRWRLVFYDCGMLNFLIKPRDLRERRWDKVRCHLFSF